MAKTEMLTIICTAPGMIRGGRRNPAIAHHATGEFTQEQLAELVADPNFYVVRGTQLDADGVAALFDELDAAPGRKGAKGA
jgi:hypothetical protein